MHNILRTTFYVLKVVNLKFYKGALYYSRNCHCCRKSETLKTLFWPLTKKINLYFWTLNFRGPTYTSKINNLRARLISKLMLQNFLYLKKRQPTYQVFFVSHFKQLHISFYHFQVLLYSDFSWKLTQCSVAWIYRRVWK